LSHAGLRFLADQGVAATTCENGMQALAMLKCQTFEVVLCDLVMPGMNGLQLLKLVHLNSPEIAFVMVAEPNDLRDALQANFAGASGFVLTPLGADSVVAELARALRIKRMEPAPAKELSAHHTDCEEMVKRQSSAETTYWGVLCRTCHDLIAFDACPYLSFGPAAAGTRPGAISCGQGHNHIYFPRDFQFILSHDVIGDAAMEQNRETYRLINPSGVPHLDRSTPKQHVRPDPPNHTPGRPALLAADPRRRTAQAAVKEIWSNWAIKKAM
jgi:CheY-like chemotaxis protein